MLTHDNLQFMSSSLAEHLSLTPDDHCLLILPLFHVNAICVSFLAPMLTGGQLSVTGRFSPARFCDDVARLRPTYFSAVPTIYALLGVTTRRDRQNRHVLVAVRRLRCRACSRQNFSTAAEQRFGLGDRRRVRAHRGHVRIGVQPACRRPETRLHGGPRLPEADTSRSWTIRGRLLPGIGRRGRRPRRQRDARLSGASRGETRADDRRGWLHTGDVGRLDADGYFTLVDRIKDVIIRGGPTCTRGDREGPRPTGGPRGGRGGRAGRGLGEEPVAYVATYPGQSGHRGPAHRAHCATGSRKSNCP